jgi:hypothetical protein
VDSLSIPLCTQQLVGSQKIKSHPDRQLPYVGAHKPRDNASWWSHKQVHDDIFLVPRRSDKHIQGSDAQKRRQGQGLGLLAVSLLPGRSSQYTEYRVAISAKISNRAGLAIEASVTPGASRTPYPPRDAPGRLSRPQNHTRRATRLVMNPFTTLVEHQVFWTCATIASTLAGP